MCVCLCVCLCVFVCVCVCVFVLVYAYACESMLRGVGKGVEGVGRPPLFRGKVYTFPI